MRPIRMAILSLLIGVTQAAQVFAQEPGQSTNSSLHPIVGIGIGASLIPRAFFPSCEHGSDGRTSGYAVEGRLVVERGNFGVEVRALRQAEFPGPGATCGHIGPIPLGGTSTVRWSLNEQATLRSSDLRIRYAVSMGEVSMVLVAGPGWIWGSNIPTLSGGVGVRARRPIRVAWDIEILTYQTSWDEKTAEWKDGSIVRLINQRRVHDWRAGFVGRVGVEIPLRR